MATIGIQVAPRIGPAYPRGSRFIAWLFLAIGRALQPSRPRPAPAGHPRQEAAQVRELAQQYLKMDPRFAADLFAAADRHERLHGIQ